MKQLTSHQNFISVLRLLAMMIALTCGGQVHAEIMVVVNANNPVNELTEREVKQLFLGRMRRFPDINSDVIVLDREPTATLYREFYKQVVHMDLMRLHRYRARYLFSGQGRLPERVSSQGAVIDYVSKKVEAVGYVDVESPEQLPPTLKVVYRQPSS